MNSRSRLLLSIGLPVLIVIVVVGAFLWQQRSSNAGQNAPTAQKLTPMTLALDWTPNTNHTGIYVALAQHWYRDEGIDLKILPYSSNVSPDTLVSSGKADVGIGSAEGIVADAATGQPVVSIAAIVQHNTSALVTLASSGITRPRDLDGKTYGGFGAPYEAAVVSAIIKKDGGKGVFKNVTLDVDAMEALKSHRIDFVWIYQGWEGIQAEREGMKLNTFYIIKNGIPDYYTPTIITGPHQIKNEPALLRRFMAATSKGYEYARTHVKEAAQMLVDEAPKGAFPDPGLVLASQQYLSPHYADQGRKWGLQDAAAWHGYPGFMLDAGAITDSAGKPIKNMNFDTLYSNEFLP
ncbi:ABC transporter substrate-binding protein [Ktedonosporobacter rubrisoli]|uniref:Thiamine pyrimidine synthase n=1 Tax=Ktedonosporobacter rubrisoli TaxID=2509675 RepID=A0A4P6JUY3_KTERU|nr:ABC transporter substrate-binding protein [Ktedonosporobacter rubrisoli]QBD79195.1 ABC transporter substrate-binding protein [Ktedonosporobacter rubrisoli]